MTVNNERYKPFGETRWSQATTPTQRRFTGQIQDFATSSMQLYFYNARYYDPALGRFTQADTLVPQLYNPQSLNRFSYVRNNPVKYTDPTGHYDDEGETCTTDWCWNNQWYNAHGYFWNAETGLWDIIGNAYFATESILISFLLDVGMFPTGDWTWTELTLIGQGIAALAQKVGGTAALHELLGGGNIWLERQSKPGFPYNLDLPFICGNDSTACADPSGTIYFYDLLFTCGGCDDAFIRATAVHETAHMIGFNNLEVFGGFFFLPQPHLMNYGGTGYFEYFAEAVTLWVYPTYLSNEAGGTYPPNNRIFFRLI